MIVPVPLALLGQWPLDKAACAAFWDSKMTIIPLILSGGSGTRLWPLSRESKPKQFLSFDGGPTLLQRTIARATGPNLDPVPIIVGAYGNHDLVRHDLKRMGRRADILLEPCRRNSAPAITVGCLHALSRDPNALVLVLASDHYIDDVGLFQSGLDEATAAAQAGYLITFGIAPREPSTAYGYILAGEAVGHGTVRKITRFVEKPDRSTAERYVDDGYLWNSGNFLFSAAAFLAEIETLAPAIPQAMRKALMPAQAGPSTWLLNAEAFGQSPAISVDVCVMEKTARAAVLPVRYDWSDIGSWPAIWQASVRDGGGNSAIGDGHLEDCRNTFVHSEGRLTVVSGVCDLAVITTPDAVLVSNLKAPDGLKSAFERLIAQGRTEAVRGLAESYPWGGADSLANGPGYCVERLTLSPGAMIRIRRASLMALKGQLLTGSLAFDSGRLADLGSFSIDDHAVHTLNNDGDLDAVFLLIGSGDGRPRDAIEDATIQGCL